MVTRPLRECVLAWEEGRAPPLLFPSPSSSSSSSGGGGGSDSGSLTVLVPVGEEAEAGSPGGPWVHATVRVFLPPPPHLVAVAAATNSSSSSSSDGKSSKKKGGKGGGASKKGGKGGKSSSSTRTITTTTTSAPAVPPLYSLETQGGLCADVLIKPWGAGGALSTRPEPVPAAPVSGSQEGRQRWRRLAMTAGGAAVTPIRLDVDVDAGGEEEGWWGWVEAARPDFRYWRQLLLFPGGGGGGADDDGEEGRRRHGRRRLLDTFGQSLIHVNRLYHQVREGVGRGRLGGLWRSHPAMHTRGPRLPHSPHPPPPPLPLSDTTPNL